MTKEKQSNGHTYPQPKETSLNRPFLEAWRKEGKLLVQSCKDCNHVFFYPRPFCPKCFSIDIRWLPTNGHGRVLSFTLVHRPNHPAFFAEVPIVLAEISLDEGASLLSRVVGENRTQIRADSTLSLVSGDMKKNYPLPTFKLVS
tara:strand:- start:951 stop:1382 length:432 start_codon:yes stop_codon:yes gene_type:complete